MTKNMGTIDRTVRIIAGAGLIAVAAAGVSPWGWAGILPLATGLMGICPAYSLFGFKTCKAT
ncbi:MAG: DUF2892 domain-containing protein [Gammaproteobacteria bacterium]|nr:DUF2892 domain-containing protein [Gammaproteobacteria bacterium]NIR28451.1 DUF2892 domain-containing protein [Gammaproteobacteria bacterium]NIR96897.1 DUF2892 domain-containing protein [Gammaproteobacteria bacterium]NIT62598.1 DUF2892 domain-containing protein [Gammaproteobacteria bacterium]NIV19555.1 DUF2892 domain-containing protein [Gammaproteobacteria bacterium]